MANHDYSNPVVWAEFLKEQGIKSDAPPPTKELLSNRPEQHLLSFLRSWADVRDSEWAASDEVAGAQGRVLEVYESLGYEF